MKIVLAGGSGQIGTILARDFHSRGHEVIILSRSPARMPWKVIQWDGECLGDWTKAVDGADVVANLTGRSVNCRYTAKNRMEIMSSRLRSVRVIGEAIRQAQRPPKVWLQASTATIYSHRFDAANDDESGVLGGFEPNVPDTWRFSIDVARSWEGVFEQVSTPNTRKVLLRSALTVSPDKGGLFDYLLWLTRLGLGGTVGDGKQFISWIHHRDFVRAIDWIIEHEKLSGPIILAAPFPRPNAEFMTELRQAWGMPIGLPVSKWMLELGTIFLRTESELVLKSRRVTPSRLLASGFTFEFPEWPKAAHDLCQEWRRRSQIGHGFEVQEAKKIVNE